MKLSYVSSTAVSQALRYQTLRMQNDLVKAQKEMATLRVADAGLALGAKNGHSVSLARDVSRLGVLIDSNQLVSSRLSSTQDALDVIATRSEDLRKALTASISSGSGFTVVKADAQSMMEAATAILNTSINGEHLFAGINTDVQPIADFNDPTSPNRVAFEQSFVTHFGFAHTDPAAANITSAQMQTYLDTVVEPQFLGAGWSNWSSATDEPIMSRIALNETAATSTSANIEGVRKVLMAAAMSSVLLEGPINIEAGGAILSKSMQVISEGIEGVTDQRTQVGVVEQRVKAASERLAMQVDLFEGSILDMEGVDPYEASTRVTSLLGQIEASYSMTARIQQLSLIKFL